MAVTFVVRTPYDVPSGRFIKRFKDQTVLGWLQRVWDSKHDAASLLGGNFYGGFGHLLDARLSESLPMPRSNKHVIELLKGHSYYTHTRTRAGNFEIETDDDEMYLCQYFFDSKFELANQNRVKFLVTNKWLPNKINQSLNSRPCTYVAARYPSQTCDSIYWDFSKTSGHRLEKIGDIVARMQQSEASTDCRLLKEFLTDVPAETSWKTTVGDLASCDRFANKTTKFKCSKHICQLYQHEQTWAFPSPLSASKSKSIYCQLIVFDDLWAKTHPVLFKSLKRMRHGTILFGKQPRLSM